MFSILHVPFKRRASQLIKRALRGFSWLDELAYRTLDDRSSSQLVKPAV